MKLPPPDAVAFLLLRGEDVRRLQDIKYSLTVRIRQESEKLALLEPLDGNGEQLTALPSFCLFASENLHINILFYIRV